MLRPFPTVETTRRQLAISTTEVSPGGGELTPLRSCSRGARARRWGVSGRLATKPSWQCYMPEVGPLSDDIPEAGPLSDDLPEAGPLSDDIPEAGPLSDDIPEAGPLSDDMPKVGPLAADMSVLRGVTGLVALDARSRVDRRTSSTACMPRPAYSA